MGNEYLKTKKYIILILLLIGSLNCGATAIGYNFIEKINILLNNNFNTKYPIDKIIYLLVALAGILLVINRDLWLVCIEDFTTLIPLSKISSPAPLYKISSPAPLYKISSPAPLPPGIPTNVKFTRPYTNTLIITWSPPKQQPSPIFKYNVVLWEENYMNSIHPYQIQNITIFAPSTTHTFTGLNGLSYGKRYSIQVSASNIMTSPFSDKIYINT